MKRRYGTHGTEAVGMWIMLWGGCSILLIGIYLTLTNTADVGITGAGRTGVGGGDTFIMPGWGGLLLGSLMFVPGLIWHITPKGKK